MTFTYHFSLNTSEPNEIFQQFKHLVKQFTNFIDPSSIILLFNDFVLPLLYNQPIYFKTVRILFIFDNVNNDTEQYLTSH